MNLCAFQLGEERYAIPVLAVEEIFRPLPITPVPGSDQRIAGLINLRGRSAAVIDLADCLPGSRHHRVPPTDQRRMILLEAARHLTEEAHAAGIRAFTEPVVLLVDRIDTILSTEDAPRHPPPAHAADSCIDEVIELPDGYCSRVDICRLIDDILHRGEPDDHHPG